MAGSIAQNHLSRVAAQGRYGDTELVHVNEQEKELLEYLGGSGNVNPNTGLTEYDPFMAAQLGLSMWQYGAGVVQERDEAAVQSDLIGDQMQGVDKALGQLGGVKSKRGGSAKADYGFGKAKLATGARTAKENLLGQYQTVAGKTGFAGSGQVEEMKSKGQEQIGTEFAFGEAGLMGQLGKELGGIEEWYAGQRGSLLGEKQKLKYEKKLMDMKSERKIFGMV